MAKKQPLSVLARSANVFQKSFSSESGLISLSESILLSLSVPVPISMILIVGVMRLCK
uniref:Uncharacterized protein n=1 Tax=Candidatus Kentrum sp. TUN TaxID=2126343 RepID=A0A451ALS8_9GAMM|nr:MAG: hypothetical protein BECKTUN1418E_GA0071001_11273 [Candidatus Kentron sp. TUN]